MLDLDFTFPKEKSAFLPLRQRADSKDHFEVTARVLVTIPNSELKLAVDHYVMTKSRIKYFTGSAQYVPDLITLICMLLTPPKGKLHG